MPHVSVEGASIYYEIHGKGEVVLLLHGLGSSLRDWELQIPALAERYTVLAVDMRGHGRSDKPSGPYSVAIFARDVASVLRTLALGPAHVVGISMGGMIGFQLAVDAPSLVRSFVAVNSGPALVPRTLREVIALASRRVALRVIGLRGLAKKVAAMNFPRPDQAAFRARLEESLASNDEAVYRAVFRSLIGWSVAERIGTIHCPVLVVSGDNDYTPVAAKEAYAAKMPRARVAVIANSRHVTPMDQTEAFNRLMLDFLAENEGAHP
jgi:3-oxoadipate enol-lactonase